VNIADGADGYVRNAIVERQRGQRVFDGRHIVDAMHTM
jgi:hypothetical protein